MMVLEFDRKNAGIAHSIYGISLQAGPLLLLAYMISRKCG